MTKILNVKDIIASNIGLSEPLKGNYSDKRYFLNYNDKNLIVKFPPLKQTQYGTPSDKFDKEAKFDLRVPLDKTNDDNNRIQQLEDKINEIDEYFASEKIRKQIFGLKAWKKARFFTSIKRNNNDDDDDDNDDDNDDNTEKKIYHPSIKGKFKVKTKGSVLNDKLFKENVHRDEYFLEDETCCIYKNEDCISNGKKIKDIKQLLNKELYQSNVSLLVEFSNIWVGNIQGIPSYKVNFNFLAIKYEPTLMSNSSLNVKGFKFENSDNEESDNEEKVDTKELDNSNTIDTEDTDDEINEKLEVQGLDTDDEEEEVVETKSKKGRKKKESVNTK